MKSRLTARRVLLVTYALLATAFIYAQERPNVLIILTDDQGYGDFSLHGNEVLSTPNLDGLAARSIRFENFHVSPVCAPTRASLLTGRYALRTNVRGVVPMYLATMRTEEVTLAEVLKSNGYSTGIFGKWHLGSYFPYHPLGQGFDTFIGFRGGATPDYFDPILESVSQGADCSSDRKQFNDRKQEFFDEMHGHSRRYEGYITDILTEQSIRYMDHCLSSDRPFFCFLSYNAPHTPVQVPDSSFQKFKETGLDNYVSGIYGMVEHLDVSIGRVLDFLDESGARKNTIVVFLTDNGANGGERFNAGMKGYKGSLDEGGCRVPLFLSWPGALPEGKQAMELCAHIDIMPTLLALIGIDTEDSCVFDGMNLMPVIEGSGNHQEDRKIFNFMAGEPENDRYRFNALSMRTSEYLYILNAQGKGRLFDMKHDFGQKHDLSQTFPEKAKQMQHEIYAWLRDVLRDGLERPPVEVGHDIEPVVDLTSRFAYFSGAISLTGSRPWDRRQVLNWHNTSDYIWWDVFVKDPGKYRVLITYGCDGIEDGSEFFLERNNRTLTMGQVSIDRFLPENTSLENRVPNGLNEINCRSCQDLGEVYLEEGRSNLYLKCTAINGAEPFRFMKLTLKKL